MDRLYSFVWSMLCWRAVQILALSPCFVDALFFCFCWLPALLILCFVVWCDGWDARKLWSDGVGGSEGFHWISTTDFRLCKHARESSLPGLHSVSQGAFLCWFCALFCLHSWQMVWKVSCCLDSCTLLVLILSSISFAFCKLLLLIPSSIVSIGFASCKLLLLLLLVSIASTVLPFARFFSFFSLLCIHRFHFL